MSALRLFLGFALIVPVLALSGCTDTVLPGCSKDSDCRNDRICVSRVCTSDPDLDANNGGDNNGGDNNGGDNNGGDNNGGDNNAQRPCLKVIEGTNVEFGVNELGSTTEKTVSITNCAEEGNLTLTRIALTQQSHLAFSVDLPAPLNGAPLVLPPEQIAEVRVSYNPRQHGDHEGAFEILTPGLEPVKVSVHGKVEGGRCPVAVAGARIQGTGAEFSDELIVPAGATLELSAAESYSPDDDGPDAITSYDWALVEQPDGSSSELAPGGQGREVALFADLPGRWVIELNVTDSKGQDACEVARVVVVSEPEEVRAGLHVHLLWDQDNSDLDVHLVHPDGEWNREPYDCYWANRNPNWGDGDDLADDPDLEVDDVDGRGPEIVSISSPEAVSYRIGAHYYHDHGAGAVAPSLRLFHDGVLFYELDGARMDQGQFWNAVSVRWGPEPEVTEVNEVLGGFPRVP